MESRVMCKKDMLDKAISLIETVKKQEGEGWKSLIRAEYIDDYDDKELRDCLEYLLGNF